LLVLLPILWLNFLNKIAATINSFYERALNPKRGDSFKGSRLSWLRPMGVVPFYYSLPRKVKAMNSSGLNIGLIAAFICMLFFIATSNLWFMVMTIILGIAGLIDQSRSHKD